MNAFSWITFALLLGLISLVGLRHAQRVKTAQTYLLADRQTPLFALIATLVMTEFNTATLISFSAAGLYASWWALTLPVIFLVGLLFYGLTVAKKWQTFSGLSVAHFFTQRYSKTMGKLTGAILFLAMAGFSATYIKALTLLFLPLCPINVWILSGVIVITVLCMTWRGGLIAIIKTDIVSFIAVLAFFPILFYFAYQLPTHTVAPLSLHQMQQALPPQFVVSLILLTIFSYILAPWYGQKVIAAQSAPIAKKAVIIAAIIIFLLYACGVSAVCLLQQKGIVLANAESALPFLLHQTPSWFAGIGYAILYLAGATTLSGVWSAMVTLLINVHDNPKTQQLRQSLSLTLACALLCYILANLFVDHILNKMILANIPVVALSFALLAGFYWDKVTIRGAYVSILIGLLWGSGCYLYYGENNGYTWYWSVYGIPLIFISGILGSLMDRARAKNVRILSAT